MALDRCCGAELIAWVKTPEGDGALISVHVDETPPNALGYRVFTQQYRGAAVVVIGRVFRIFPLDAVEWLRWPE
jgi:hypothetical protein